MTTITEVFEEVEVLKDSVSEAKQQKSERVGQLSEQMKILKSFGTETVKDAKDKIEKLKNKKVSVGNKAIKLFDELREQYEW